MLSVLEGLAGVVCLIDDVLVYAKGRLRAVLKHLQEKGVTLNQEKCLFSQNRVKFQGHIPNGSGISPDPEKISAICKLKRPENVSELRCFLGMVNQMSKVAPNLAEKTKPLRDLNIRSQWVWGSA